MGPGSRNFPSGSGPPPALASYSAFSMPYSTHQAPAPATWAPVPWRDAMNGVWLNDQERQKVPLLSVILAVG